MLLGSITSFIDAHSQWALLMMFGLMLLESFGSSRSGEHGGGQSGRRSDVGLSSVGSLRGKVGFVPSSWGR